ncbi:endonuclease/exonuclease/phosphatase family protein [Mycolicibacterium arseniciresistens]|uniref:Endonuclease/exonuclease/phosphatase family protein n=1 Tax=Mycolicibacterium arseniciresistens TaxID=3062257 RepID=A0ABT8UH80_9MYCO|nr:endonuclease/exonuclease/phosphatase family protein [Mycolicibacterium arseniciresistens]MDO3636506.1 endonuclease/exonuclease/phosphatase family protein [Mycolicibacterium arseniciresistens]
MRILLTVLGVLALGAAALGLAARYVPIDGHAVLIVASAAPYLMLAAPVAVALLGLGRRWVLTGLAALLSVTLLVVMLPRYLGSEHAAESSVQLRVLTANLGMGRADPRALAAAANATADVLVVEEMTAEAATGLSRAGLDRAFPHRMLDPHPMAGGIGVWSRHPITDSGFVEDYTLSTLRMRIQVPGVAIAPTVVAIHLPAPWPMPIGAWRRDLARLPATLRELGGQAGAGAVIVAGDLNATMDMAPFRRLLDEGYRTATEQAGAGLGRTFPGGRRIPPVLGIDHVLVRNCVATSARTVGLPGSDHLGLLVGVEVPLDP